MKAIARSLVVVLVALIAVPALVVSVAMTTAVQLLAVTAFYMGGTEHPLSTPPDTPAFIASYMNLADQNYIIPGTGTTPTQHVAVVYPAQFFPVFGSTTFDDSVAAGRVNLNSCLRGMSCNNGDPIPQTETFDVFGYSQSAVVASLVKGDLIANPTRAPADTNFVLIANPMRPNGGILGRGFEGQTIPIIGITFYGPTPNSCPSADPCTQAQTGHPVYDTVDVAQQYDLLGGDAPAVAWNVLAWANSAAAYYYLHGNVPSQSLNQAISQGAYGDTSYYLLPSTRLPILLPLQQIGVPDPLLAVVDAPLRVLIESAYYRDTSPGQSVTFQLLPQKDVGTLAVNLIASIPVGIDDGLQEAGVGRALGTNNLDRPFGVGGQTYDKTTGNPAGVETGGNVFTPPVAPNGAQTQATVDASSTPKIASEPASGTPFPETSKNQKAELGNTVTQAPASPNATLPKRPLQIVRDSLNFDPTKRPSAVGPSGDGPLKRIVNTLTGQKPTATTSSDAAGDTSAGAQKAAA